MMLKTGALIKTIIIAKNAHLKNLFAMEDNTARRCDLKKRLFFSSRIVLIQKWMEIMMEIPVKMTLVLVKKEDIKRVIGPTHLNLYNQ
ncbi:hypothetical protein A8F97_09960 [Pectobacterium parmentieri]|nr:hypothetical protein A8F97_09960 [Pectobacterium parmentieri]